jgi:hypothetical protein
MGQRLLFGALALAAAVSVHAESPYLVLPAVIYTDPPADPKYPASSQAVQFESHGSLINGQLYRPVGKGAHPTAQIGSESASVLGVGLIAPWDISFDARAWTALSAAQRRTAGIATFDDVDGRLVGADARSLTDAVLHDGARFDLSRLAASLAVKPLLIVTATRDDADDQAAGLQAGLLQAHAEHVVVRVLASDHSFNDQRIALQVAVYRWLASLPGAPD